MPNALDRNLVSGNPLPADDPRVHDFRSDLGIRLTGAFLPGRFRLYVYFVYVFISLQAGSAMAALFGAIDITFRERLVMVGMMFLTITQIGLLIIDRLHHRKLDLTMDFFYRCCTKKRYDVGSEFSIMKDRVTGIKNMLNILTRLLQGVFFMFLSYEQISAAISGRDWIRLPAAFYVPGYKLSLFHYGGAMLFFAIYALVQISHFYSVPCIFVSVVSQILVQYDILLQSISLLDKRARVKMEILGRSNFNESRQICFNENMHHYREIIGCTEIIKPYLNNLFTLLTVLCSMTIATTGFVAYDAFKDGSYLEVLLQTSRVVAISLLAFNCCSYGQQLITKIDELRFALYENEWYDMPIALRRDLRFALLSTAKPLVIKSLLNVPASMKTYYEFFSTAFNVMMIFVNIKGK